MITEKGEVGIQDGRFTFLLPVTVELIYFSFSLINTPPLLTAIIAFPALFVLPGVMLLVALRGGIENVVKLVVEVFFVSTVIMVILTSLMLMLGIPLISFTYSLLALSFALSLVVITLIRKIEFKPSKSEILLLALAFSSYVLILLYFSGIPRLFTCAPRSRVDFTKFIMKEGNKQKNKYGRIYRTI
ncbi:MAG: hypothetical protein ACTSYD_01125 [Candidatus Heimdallarchaeaceae archaeon]